MSSSAKQKQEQESQHSCYTSIIYRFDYRPRGSRARHCHECAGGEGCRPRRGAGGTQAEGRTIFGAHGLEITNGSLSHAAAEVQDVHVFGRVPYGGLVDECDQVLGGAPLDSKLVHEANLHKAHNPWAQGRGANWQAARGPYGQVSSIR